MYKLIIFDLDGTLLDTLEDLVDSANAMLSHFGFEKRTVDEIRQFVGNGMRNLVERCLPYKIAEDEYEKCYEFFRTSYNKNMQNKTKPYDGIIELLEKLQSMGIKSAVVSNKNDDAVKKLCSDYFGNLVSAAIGRKDGIPAKPDPTMVFSVIESFGVEKEDCIFVGDSDTDILTAKNAGLVSTGVLWGFRDRKVLAQAGADIIIEKPEDFIDLFFQK
ncbi:MAG: HAD family hydrolase [Ruminococcaceae bacterium]|nr:HAD family hydrolase [Oscillospiraceae bacterium]